jgi:hypothetical protein
MTHVQRADKSRLPLMRKLFGADTLRLNAVQALLDPSTDTGRLDLVRAVLYANDADFNTLYELFAAYPAPDRRLGLVESMLTADYTRYALVQAVLDLEYDARRQELMQAVLDADGLRLALVQALYGPGAVYVEVQR